MFTLNILTPYLPKKLNKVIQLPIYLSKIARWQTFSNHLYHSEFCSESKLFAQTQVNTAN